MFHDFFHGHPNLMTPRIISRGMLASGRDGQAAAYELSSGTDFNHNPIFGVTVVRQWADGTLENWEDKGKLFQGSGARANAEAYVSGLKREARQMIRKYGR